LKFAKPDGDHAAMLASGRWKEAVQGYLAAIAYTDMNIGRLIDALDQSEYRNNTILVFWGDHGWHLGEKEHWRKFTLWEEAARAPMIWVAPGVTSAGGKCERTVDFSCIYPTLCELTGIEMYDETKDPMEWKNLATDPQFTSVKEELKGFLPTDNKPDLGDAAGKNKNRKNNGTEKKNRNQNKKNKDNKTNDKTENTNSR
jgi:arylsulfatase A-like enzyme